MKAIAIKSTRLMLALLVAGLIASAGNQAVASARDLGSYPAPGQLIDVGGHRLHVRCLGEGDPTVVFEAGMSGWSTDWTLVQPDVAKATRVCTYDRAGYGWSDPGPRPRDSRQVAAELHTLLSRSGVDGRIILVGHSLGGLFAQYYARTYPEQIAGVVLVDSVHPEQSLRMSDEVREEYEGNLETLTRVTRILAPTGLLRLAGLPVTIIADKLPGEYQAEARALGYQSKAYRALDDEMASFQQSQAEVREAGPLPNVPLVVISSSSVEGFPPGFTADTVKPTWDELQADLSAWATLPQIVAVNSGHYVHIDQPAVVTRTVLEMVNVIRGQ